MFQEQRSNTKNEMEIFKKGLLKALNVKWALVNTRLRIAAV